MIAQVAALRPLRLPNFALFWSAQALSKLGDPITTIALATISYRATRSALFTTLAVLVTIVPAALFGFAAGAVSDALGHRRALVVCDLARVALIGAIPGALAFGAPLAVALAIAFIAGIFAAIFNPARVAIVPLLVRSEELGSGNALVFATDRTVEIAGALLGGVLVAVLADAALYVDALTFALSAMLLSRIRIADSAMGGISFSAIRRDVADGLAFIRRSEVLLANTVFSLVAQLSIPIYNGLLPVLIFRRFANGDPDLGAWQFGVAEGVYALGAVLGALAIPGYMRRIDPGLLVIGGFAGFGLMLVAIGSTPTFILLIPLLVLAGIVNMFFFVPNVTIVQEVTPERLRGRVVGVRTALLNLTWLPLVLGAGRLADLMDVGLLLVLGGFFTTTTALIASRVGSLRQNAEGRRAGPRDPGPSA